MRATKMKKTTYFWPFFWIAVNLLIWGWTSGFIQEKILGEKATEQPIRTLEEVSPEAARLNKDAPTSTKQ